MAKKLVVLDDDVKLKLQKMKKYNPDYRVRERAEAILLLSEGLSSRAVGEKLELSSKTIETTKKAWLEEKFLSLHDKPRSGAPLKLTQDEQEKILLSVKKEPLSTKEVLDKHLKSDGTIITLDTLRNFLKKNE